MVFNVGFFILVVVILEFLLNGLCEEIGIFLVGIEFFVFCDIFSYILGIIFFIWEYDVYLFFLF